MPIVGTYRDAARMDYNPSTENILNFGVSALTDIYGGKAFKLIGFPKNLGYIWGHMASQAERMPEPFYGKYIDKWRKKLKNNTLKHFNGGSLNHIPFYQSGTNEDGIVIIEDPKLAASEINTTNKNTAKGLFKGITSGTILPTVPNIGRMVYSAYKGWIDPETGLNTGTAPLPGMKAKNAYEALQMVKAMKAAKAAKVAKAMKPAKKVPISKLAYKVEDPMKVIESSNLTRASKLNIKLILEAQPEEERLKIAEVIASHPEEFDKYGNLTPAKLAGWVNWIKKNLKLNTRYRTKVLDLTRPHMRSNIFGEAEKNNRYTVGWKRTTGLKPDMEL